MRIRLESKSKYITRDVPDEGQYIQRSVFTSSVEVSIQMRTQITYKFKNS